MDDARREVLFKQAKKLLVKALQNEPSLEAELRRERMEDFAGEDLEQAFAQIPVERFQEEGVADLSLDELAHFSEKAGIATAEALKRHLSKQPCFGETKYVDADYSRTQGRDALRLEIESVIARSLAAGGAGAWVCVARAGRARVASLPLLRAALIRRQEAEIEEQKRRAADEHLRQIAEDARRRTEAEKRAEAEKRLAETEGRSKPEDAAKPRDLDEQAQEFKSFAEAEAAEKRRLALDEVERSSERAYTVAKWALLGIVLLALGMRYLENHPRGAKTGAGQAGIEWVDIPGGTFMMGSETGKSGEKPVHRVTVKTFQMARTEVTNKQYRACAEAGACKPPSGYEGGDDQPVVAVDWDQAAAFAAWVGGRLPSEAEWEYAARSAGRDIKYPWGNEDATCERAVMMNKGGFGCGRNATWPVCSKAKGNTAQGLCDMAGNAMEWTQDRYHDSYGGAPDDGSAWESPAGSYGVIRGASCYDGAVDVRAANRIRVDPGSRYLFVGLRPVR